MSTRVAKPHIDAVRRFNRFYTARIGVLDEAHLESDFSLGEVRVLYELAHREQAIASELAAALRIDEGHLSRMLRGLARRRLISRSASPADGRRRLLALTPHGRRAFAALDARAHAEIAGMLREVPADKRGELVAAMENIRRVLATRDDETMRPEPSFTLRRHRPGDMGWVVHRHGALYAEEYGWDERFEALVAAIVAKFVQHFDPKHERCWIAERDGAIVGSILLVRQSDTVAKLRLLLVEPSARGLGIGGRLIDECVRFARAAGYRKITLWTQDNLHSARRLYQAAGFRLVRRKRHADFGFDLVAETWDKQL